ncbi:hypothetical protein B0T10DRAFT_585174, partial [Thelonectria olida]
MFGTLVSNDSDRDALQFIENPDPVAAVSRNLQNTKHIACMSCRSRKVRCSGRRTGCQRCVLMGIKCVYPENQRRNRRQESITSSGTASSKRNWKSPTRVTRDGAEQCAKNKQTKHGRDPELDDLHDKLSNDSDTDMSLPSIGMICTPARPSSEGGPSSSSTDNATSASDLTTSESSCSTGSHRPPVALPDQFPELFETDTFLSSLLSPPKMDSVVDLDFWEEIYSTHGCDMPWTMNAGEEGTTAGPALSEPPSIEPPGGGSGANTRTESDSCSCLLSSISFLERLASRSASRESRIDVIFADVRNSMEALAAFIACERCAAREELNMVLAMAARHISIICGKLANCYRHLRGLSGDTNNNDSSHQQQLDRDASIPGTVDISVSTYSVDRREGLHLLKSLATFQIREFQQHINTIKSRYPPQPNQGQAGTLTEAENHVKLAQVTISSY